VKAVIYHAYDDIRVEDLPIPSISSQELLVKVQGCGLCGSDIIKVQQHSPPPVVLGHELTGTIVAKGRDVTSFSTGERVMVAHHVPCGACHYCTHGNYSMCASFKASNIDPCGFAEYIRVPASHVRWTTLALPETLSAEEGSFIEPLACCVRAVERTPLLPGDSVVVMGLGSIGLLMVQAVKAIGAVNDRTGAGVRVFGVDIVPERLQLARDLGADDVFLASDEEHELFGLLAPYTKGRGADAAILTAVGARPFMQAVSSVRKGGAIHLFAAHAGTVPVDLETIYQRELSILSTYSSSPAALYTARGLLASEKVRADGIISHRLPLERFADGLALMQERRALKVYFQIAGETKDG
jgi:L-iditol 2-dehydrogenase